VGRKRSLAFHNLIDWETRGWLGKISWLDGLSLVFEHVILNPWELWHHRNCVWHKEILQLGLGIERLNILGEVRKFRSSWVYIFELLKILFWRLCEKADLEWKLGVVPETSHINVRSSGVWVRVIFKLWVSGGVVRWLPVGWLWNTWRIVTNCVS